MKLGNLGELREKMLCVLMEHKIAWCGEVPTPNLSMLPRHPPPRSTQASADGLIGNVWQQVENRLVDVSWRDR